MKTNYPFGTKLTRTEMKQIFGAEVPPDGGGRSCGLVFNNCAVFSLTCANPDAFCEVFGQGLRCCHYDPPSDLGIKFCGNVHSCRSGNYCS